MNLIYQEYGNLKNGEVCWGSQFLSVESYHHGALYLNRQKPL